MEDREFSSPVCYLYYDTYQVPIPEPGTSAFCTSCTSFIAALYENAGGENGIGLEQLSSDKILEFLLSQERWVYERKGDIVDSVEKGCRLCVVVFEGLGEDEREVLNVWRQRGKEGGEMVFEFERDVSGCGFGFRLAPLYTRDGVAIKG